MTWQVWLFTAVLGIIITAQMIEFFRRKQDDAQKPAEQWRIPRAMEQSVVDFAQWEKSADWLTIIKPYAEHYYLTGLSDLERAADVEEVKYKQGYCAAWRQLLTATMIERSRAEKQLRDEDALDGRNRGRGVATRQ